MRDDINPHENARQKVRKSFLLPGSILIHNLSLLHN